jgi:tetratricopeptide (TPR) repeat protein
MDSTIQSLTQKLLGKASLEDCSIADLQLLVNLYPYFVPAQLLYAQKQKDTNTVLYHQELQKTSLYYQNPFWLQHILANDKKIEDEPVITNSFIKEEIVKEREVFIPTEKEIIESAVTVDAVNIPVEEKLITPENKEEEVIAELPQEESKSNKDGEESPETDFQTSREESIEVSEKSIAMLAAAKLKLNEPVSDDAPLFEALHTVDYFASQGIKLSQEGIPKDKFGQQLKSFTEWLKAMKRIPQSEIVKAINTAETDKKVEQLAEHSLEQGEIVTETMAEVWAKQGNREKAIEVYEKLSLQNPAKSHYFAALIEQLSNN